MSKSSALMSTVLTLVGLVVACGGTSAAAEPVPFDNASVDVPQRMSPQICEGAANGKRFSVVGYPYWASGTVAQDDVAFIHLREKQEGDAARSGPYVPINVKIRGLFGLGGDIEKPVLENATSESSRAGRNTRTDTKGTITNESMRLHLKDGSTANHLVKVRATIQVVGGKGACNLDLVEAAKEP